MENIEKIERRGSVFVEHKNSINPGVYNGTMGGYQVYFYVDGKMFNFRTNIGVRCISCPVRVHVEKNGEIWVEVL